MIFRDVLRLIGRKQSYWPLLLMLACSSFAHSETTVRCPLSGEAKLNTVEGWIANPKQTENRTLTLLRVCPIGFQMDAHAIENLTSAKATPAEMNLLNQITAPKLNLEQARFQVDEIERRTGSVKNADTLTAFRTRILLLKQAIYSDSRPVGTYRYDAGKGLLVVPLGPEDYVFWKVDAGTEKTLSANWKDVKVVEPYDQDSNRSRTLTLTAPPVSQKGMPLSIFRTLIEEEYPPIVEAALSDGKKLTEAGDYDKAIQFYDLAYAMRPDWQVHNEKIPQELEKLDAAKKAALTVKESVDVLRPKGEWLDLKTKLIWTLVDDGYDLDWKDAGKYCKSLPTGGATGWRLPTEAELRGIADSSLTAATAPSPADFFYQTTDGKLDKIPKGHQWEYHIEGKITLSNPVVWTATLNGYGKAQIFNFDTLESSPYPQTEKKFLRTLCVRHGDQNP